MPQVAWGAALSRCCSFGMPSEFLAAELRGYCYGRSATLGDFAGAASLEAKTSGQGHELFLLFAVDYRQNALTAVPSFVALLFVHASPFGALAHDGGRIPEVIECS